MRGRVFRPNQWEMPKINIEDSRQGRKKKEKTKWPIIGTTKP